MRRRSGRLLGVIGAVAGLVVLAVLALPAPSPAQTPAAKPAAGLPEGYAGADTCKGCHEDQFNVFGQTKMGRLFIHHPRTPQEQLVCETCHGPGRAHAEAGGGRGVGNLITFAKNDKTPIDKRNQICLSCHQKGARLFWQGSAHEGRSVACTSCHTIMTRVSPENQLKKATQIETCGQCHLQKRAQTMRSTHMPLREGKMTCTSCHNPHGTVTPSLLKENTVNETCYNCHAEKRGPYLWEHAPVVESCVNCHDPHGTNHEKMLKLAKVRLCQPCHDSSGHPINPYGPGNPNLTSNKFVLGRQCLNCHVNIHGSNHPSGSFFTR